MKVTSFTDQFASLPHYIGDLPAIVPQLISHLPVEKWTLLVGAAAIGGCAGASVFGTSMALGATAAAYLAWRKQRLTPATPLAQPVDDTVASAAAALLSARQEREAWWHLVLELDRGLNPTLALRTLQHHVNKLMNDGNFSEVDDTLRFFDPTRVSTGLATVLYMLTERCKDVLVYRYSYNILLRDKMRAQGTNPEQALGQKLPAIPQAAK